MRFGESIMPTISERILITPVKVFLGLGIVACGLLYVARGPGTNYSQEISDVSSQLKAAQVKLKSTEETAANKPKFQEEMERVSQTFRLALEYLPKELDIQDILKKIYSEARTSGVELTNFKPKDTVAKDFFEEIPMEIEVGGTYPQLVLFLANIGKLPRIINIKNVDIGNPILIDGYPTLKLKGTLIGYRYKEQVK
jgi:type IV pilus assembly protein PilO